MIPKYCFYCFSLAAIFITATSCRQKSNRDGSYNPDEYREMGMPDHTRLWNVKDYSEACVVLNNIKAIKPHALPRKSDIGSGAIFSRIVDTDNLAFLESDSMSLNEKAMLIQHYIDIQGCFVTAYTEIDNRKQYYNHELIDLYIFGLTIAQDMLDLGRRINRSVKNKDVELQYGYASIKKMYSTMILFILINQQKSYFFDKNDLERLSGFIYDSILINQTWMKGTPAGGIRHQLETIIEQTSSETIRKKYSELLELL